MNDLAQMILINYKEALFVEKTVEEALFKGWKVPFLEKIEENVGFKLIPNNEFGFFVGVCKLHGLHAIVYFFVQTYL